MYHRQEATESDELRARFTAWMDILLYRARLNFIHKESRKIQTVSFDELDEDTLLVSENTVTADWCLEQKRTFEFEEERLTKAFAELPIKRQRILEMLFIEEKKPAQIAKELNCSTMYVYDQKRQALQKLRKILERDSDIL